MNRVQVASAKAGRWAKAGGKWKRDLRNWSWGYFFVAPSLLFFLVFSLYPVLKTLILSFQSYTLEAGTKWIGLNNYQALMRDRVFAQVLKNSLLYFLGIVPLGTALTLVLSVLIIQLPAKLANFFKAAYYLPVVASGVVLSLIWLYLFNPAFGVLNYLLGVVGLGPVLWLGNYKTALWSLVAMYHGTHWGGSIVLACAALDSIPATLYEAATIDGASRLRQFRSITLPLLKPILTYIIIMATISSLQIFNQIFLMTNGGPGRITTNLVYYVYITAFQNFNFGLGSAQVMVLLVVTVTLAIVQYRYLAIEVEY